MNHRFQGLLLASALVLCHPLAVAQDEPVVPSDAAAEEEAPAPRADLSGPNELVRNGNYAEAEPLLAAAVEEFPDDPRARLMYGEILLALGRYEDARPQLAKCAELEPDRARVHFQLATAMENSGDGAGALEHYAREIELNDDAPIKIMAHLNRSVLLQKEQQWTRAAAELEAVLGLDADELRIYGDLAGLYLQAGELDRAADALERGVEDGFSSPRHFYILGSRYYQTEAFEKAVAAFRRALGLNAGYADAERSLGAALDQLGKAREAVEHFRRYLELRPDAPEAAELRKRIADVSGS